MKTIKLFVLAFVLPLVLQAQQDTLHRDYKNYFGLGIGSGKGTSYNTFSSAFMMWQRKNNYVSLGGTSVENLSLIFSGDEPQESTSSNNLIIGRSITINKYLNFQFGAGIAWVEDVSKGKYLYNTCKGWMCLFGHDVYERINRKTIGLPLEFKANFYTGSAFAVSLGLNASINSLNSFAGVSIGLTGGRLRDRVFRRK